MGWGRRSADDEQVRAALLKVAAHELSSLGGKSNEKTYLATLYAEQCRTNDLLEQLLTSMSANER